MSADVFLGTNVLVYAAVRTGRDEPKRRRALELIEGEDFAISAQVLQEFYVTVVKRAERRRPAQEALEWIEQLLAFPCQPVDRELVVIAIGLSARFRISYRDAAILAAAMAQGAAALYSEDLNHGQRYETVRVVKPFAPRK